MINTPRPQSMKYAVWFMYAGAVVSIAIGVIGALSAHSIFSHMLSQMESEMPASQRAAMPPLNTMSGPLGAGMIVEAIILALLWLWMAWKNGQGRQWARVLSTVFFGILCLGTISSIVNVSLMGAGFMIGYLVMFAVGLATIILLWRRESTQYYQAVKLQALGGYPPVPGGPGGYYGYGTPQSTYGYGYPPPPPNPEDPVYPNE